LTNQTALRRTPEHELSPEILQLAEDLKRAVAWWRLWNWERRECLKNQDPTGQLHMVVDG
jgi:hypothetical protein